MESKDSKGDKIMDKNSKQNVKDRLNKIMNDKVDLITEHLKEGRLKYAKIETRALKAYLDCQLSIAKKEARMDQPESWTEEDES